MVMDNFESTGWPNLEPQLHTAALVGCGDRLFAVLSRPKSAGHVPLRTCIEKFDYLAKSDANTGYEPDEFDKITVVNNDTMLMDDPDLDEISDFSKNSRENTGEFGVPTMFETSVSRVSHGDFPLRK